MSAVAGPDTVARLAAWLGRLTDGVPDAGRLQRRVPTGGGWSIDTWIVQVAGAARPLAVVRLQPERRSMFPDYDLGRQAAVLHALEGAVGVPVPPLLGVDLDGAELGRPAFVMGFVEGRAPSDDRPSFVEAGWLHDAAAAQQRRFHEDLLAHLAAVHTLEVAAIGLEWLAGPGPSSAPAAIDALRRVWDYDQGPVATPIVQQAFAEVAGTAPPVDPSPATLLWGDARPANVLCEPDGFAVVALLDWELATHGPPEFDVAWMMEMNWMRAQGAGLAPLPGFLDDDAAVAHYEAVSGRVLGGLGWYRRFAALKVAVLMHRYLRAMVHAGEVPATHRILTDNVSTRRLDSLLGPG